MHIAENFISPNEVVINNEREWRALVKHLDDQGYVDIHRDMPKEIPGLVAISVVRARGDRVKPIFTVTEKSAAMDRALNSIKLFADINPSGRRPAVY